MRISRFAYPPRGLGNDLSQHQRGCGYGDMEALLDGVLCHELRLETRAVITADREIK